MTTMSESLSIASRTPPTATGKGGCKWPDRVPDTASESPHPSFPAAVGFGKTSTVRGWGGLQPTGPVSPVGVSTEPPQSGKSDGSEASPSSHR